MGFYKIVIDTKGSDKGPKTIIKGASMALKEFDEIAFNMDYYI